MARKTARRPHHEPPKVWHNQDVIGRARPARGAPPSVRAPAVETPVAPVTPSNGPRRMAPVKSLTDSERELERLLAKLSLAEGRVAITEAADAVFRAGHAIPDDQHVHVQLLEHDDESRVCASIQRLGVILGDEPPKRPQVLDARLRRLEEFAEESETRSLAKQLRRHLKTIELPPSG